jgi:hypothetical protein
MLGVSPAKLSFPYLSCQLWGGRKEIYRIRNSTYEHVTGLNSYQYSNSAVLSLQQEYNKDDSLSTPAAVTYINDKNRLDIIPTDNHMM